MNGKVYPLVDDFSLTSSGIIYKIVSRLGLGGTSNKHITKRILYLIAITWLPLLALSALQGLAFGDKVEIPFWKDFAIHSKFLIILPLLLLAEGPFDLKLKDLTMQFFRSGILDEKDFGKYEEIKRKVKRLTDSILPDIFILILIVINLLFRFISVGSDQISIWIFLPDNQASSISWAGIYLAIICGPFFQFILMRWIWRWIIWFIYFRELARLQLKLNPAHPDMAGGLGFLGYPPGPFIQVVFALAILFSTAIAEKIYFLHDKLQTYYPLMAAFALLSILMNVLPLMVFMKPMIAKRREGFFEYSALIQDHHRQFDEKWLGKDREPVLPGFADASSMADFNGSFEVVKNMKTLPFDIKIMVSTIIFAILPMLPLVAFEYNLTDLMVKVLKMLAV
jgi:hypothetical protein